MKNIKWKYRYGPGSARAEVGCIIMHVNLYRVGTVTKRWFADVSVRELSGTFRQGLIRKSMAKTKEDAVQLARELLLDYHTCLKIEMANFDLVE